MQRDECTLGVEQQIARAQGITEAFRLVASAVGFSFFWVGSLREERGCDCLTTSRQKNRAGLSREERYRHQRLLQATKEVATVRAGVPQTGLSNSVLVSIVPIA